MKKIIIAVTFVITTLISCGKADPNQQVDEGNVKNNIYTSEEIGWSIEIPEDWTVIDKEQTKASNERGLKAIEETIDGKIDYSELRNLIGFQKNQFNLFQSTSEPYVEEYDGEWEENNEALKQIIYMTYVNNGIKTDSSATTIEKINGLDFKKFSFTIYSPNDEVILEQIMYSRFIEGYDFSVNINYNNEEDKEVMMNVWKNSRFKKSKAKKI
ncbi:hypothetical protein [Flavobacterium okayamense]|uniref:Lipoprotein n=1 Tax=Flavobacterium okayamense TaxID=2830782 RepID=A0ABM7S530_9FLAO|nr:hypothetical protein [Flavobacterium okayamense]BCY28651.1 hypothetical protein KK2020170_15190 [Flavobacterium okayamense]